MQREFKGVWIPASVWLDKRLTLVEKALLAEIDSFSGNGKTFHKANTTIEKEYGISRPTITRAIKKLETLGFVSVSFDGRTRNILLQAEGKNLSGSPKKMIRQNEKNDQADCSNVTYTNTRERTKDNTLKKEVVLPWDSKEFSKAWEVWLSERKDRGTKKYTFRGEQAALHKLQNDAQGDEATAIAIIHQSIANSWQGLFPLKNQKNERERTNTTDGSLIAEHLRRLAANSSEGLG